MKQMQITLGSLFDGIGGFPLAGQMAGITPIWASEIEPFPVRVTEKRFPGMKHYGDIHGVNGADIEPVDVIAFGSPCQDLSIAGKQAGLDGSRSSLFYEAVRIITEMRNATNGKYPRWAVWENVPGALSSHDGQDFRQVLEALVRVKNKSADVLMPENGKWLSAGEILGDGYSLAWRILDASKGWGVAQRRRRIFAVVDLDGERAGQVLFESESVSGYTPPRGEAREGTSGDAQTGAYASGFCTEHSGDSRGIGYGQEKSPTLRAGVVPGVAIEYHPADSRIRISEDGQCQTLCSRMGTGGGNVPLTLCEPKAYGISADQSNAMLSDNPHSGVYEADTSRTLDCSGGNPVCNQGGIAIVEPMPPAYALQGSMIGRKDENGPQGDGVNEEVSFTLNTIDRHAVAMTTGSYTHLENEKTPTLMARDWKDAPIVGIQDARYTVRRLTPGECCRLQGFPDGWCDGLSTENPTDEEIECWTRVFNDWDDVSGKGRRKRTRTQIIKWLNHPNSDAAEYKAYGNSVAVPCVFFVLAGIVWANNMEVSE